MLTHTPPTVDPLHQCARTDCNAERLPNTGDLVNLLCQAHTDAWQDRLHQLATRYPTTPRVLAELDRDHHAATRPTFSHPRTPLSDVGVCSRCGQAERAWPDHLCEDCRRG